MKIKELIRSILRIFSARSDRKLTGSIGVSGEVLKRTIEDQLAPSNMFISDRKFSAWGTADMESFLSLDFTDAKEYLPESFDCDDFSYVLLGRMTEAHPDIAFGLAWVTYKNWRGELVAHALNVYFDADEGEMMFVEPQNDRIFDPPVEWNTFLVVI